MSYQSIMSPFLRTCWYHSEKSPSLCTVIPIRAASSILAVEAAFPAAPLGIGPCVAPGADADLPDGAEAFAMGL